MKIAFVNTGRYTGSRGITAFSDPVHLVAMHNLCKKAGHQSKIVQLGAPSYPESIAEVQAFQPDVLALSFLAPFKSDVEVVDQLLHDFRGKGARLLLGGPDVELDPRFYTTWFRAEDWRSCALVQGPGERLIAAIVGCDFDLARPAVQAQLEAEGATFSCTDGIYQISALPETSLDIQDHTRDYDLALFNDKAGVKWATGCWAACSFCPNIPGRSGYKAAELVTREVRYLQSLGATKLDIASPQFTAHPARSSAVIDALPDDCPPVFFSSRVDSLYHAITRFPEPWKRFAQNNMHGIGLGVDSFLPAKLMRLRKYSNIAQAEAQEERLDAVLSFFSETKLNVVFYMITFDWEMDLHEAKLELEALLHYLNRYSSTMQIAPENVTNVLSANKGTEFSGARKPIDFLRFEREPRLFLMLYSMYATHELLEQIIMASDESHELMEAAAARVMVKFGLRLLQELAASAPDGADFTRSFAVLHDTLDTIFQEEQGAYHSRRIQEELLAIYPPKPQRKLRKWLEKTARGMQKTLAREYEILLTRKALHRMKINGKIDEKTLHKQLRKYA